MEIACFIVGRRDVHDAVPADVAPLSAVVYSGQIITEIVHLAVLRGDDIGTASIGGTPLSMHFDEGDAVLEHGAWTMGCR